MQEVKRIPLEGLPNTRDLGGYLSGDGRAIKPHKLIRSGELSALTESDKRILLEEYELKKILDFRTSMEANEHPDPKLSGVTYIHHPIMEESALGITREKDDDTEQNKNVVDTVLAFMQDSDEGCVKYMAEMYNQLITGEYSKNQYRKFFIHVLEQEEGALLWHCTAGKDRAGTAAILLLSALDIPREQIVADYMKVNEFNKAAIEEKIQKVLQMTGNKEAAGLIKALFSVSIEYIESVYKVISDQYGSMDNYLLKEMDLSEEKRSLLKNIYLQ